MRLLPLYYSQAPISLAPVRRSEPPPPPKLCYGDHYRAAAPLPPSEESLRRRAYRHAHSKRITPKLWTPERIARIIALRREGLTFAEVAQRVGREWQIQISSESVRTAIRTYSTER